MDETKASNRVQLCGVMAGRPAFSHESRGERFFTFPLEIERLSGTTDTVHIILREGLLAAAEVGAAEKLLVTGELRSYNNRSGEGPRLVITVFARELCFADGPDENHVWLTGTLCKAPNLRTTPMGRDICDLMLAVNRHYGRSDYLPCITWGTRAMEASDWRVGDRVCLTGRLQSRRYIKILDGAQVEKTAFEVSVTDIFRAPD